MRFVRKILTRKLSVERKGKFKPVFSFFNYLVDGDPKVEVSKLAPFAFSNKSCTL